MRESKQLQNLYRYEPTEIRRVRKYDPEEENERCYELIHIKLAPHRLKMLSIINIAILVVILFALFVGAIILPKPIESKIEKRALATKPSFSLQNLFSGEFSRSTETYFSDTFPLRELFVSLSATINENHGIRFDDVRVIAPSGDAQNMTTSANTSSGINSTEPTGQSAQPIKGNTIASGTTTQTPSPVDENATGTVSNGIFICQGRAMSLYGGSHESARRYASVLNTYADSMPDVQIYNMIIPTAAEFYLPQKYKSMSQSQKDVIDLVYNMLNPSIKKVDAYNTISDHTSEYLYFKTDHHWTGRGAYYAYTAFCKQAGFEPLSISEFETRTLDNFIGTMYAETQDSTLLADPDYVDYYIFKQPYTAMRYDRGATNNPIPHNLWGEYAKSPNSYSVFLQGDFPLIEVNTDIHNGRKIMIVKESFGNAFAPFLINHYEKVYIVDQRYFERPLIQFIKDQGINELIFANNAFAVCTPYQINCIENLKNAHVYIPPKPVIIPEPEKNTLESQEERIEAENISPEASEPQVIKIKPQEEIPTGKLKPRKLK